MYCIWHRTVRGIEPVTLGNCRKSCPDTWCPASAPAPSSCCAAPAAWSTPPGHNTLVPKLREKKYVLDTAVRNIFGLVK